MCENTLILFINSDTLTTICQAVFQRSTEHLLHTSINSPEKIRYLQSDKAVTQSISLYLSYNLTIFVKAEAKKQSGKLQGVQMVCILTLLLKGNLLFQS